MCKKSLFNSLSFHRNIDNYTYIYHMVYTQYYYYQKIIYRYLAPNYFHGAKKEKTDSVSLKKKR